MAYDPGAIDATLAAALGDDPGLIAELRSAFVTSATRALMELATADTPAGWRAAATRLKGLAASFGAVRLMALAGRAADGGPGDALLIRQIGRMIDRL